MTDPAGTAPRFQLSGIGALQRGRQVTGPAGFSSFGATVGTTVVMTFPVPSGCEDSQQRPVTSPSCCVDEESQRSGEGLRLFDERVVAALGNHREPSVGDEPADEWGVAGTMKSSAPCTISVG